MSRNCIPRTVWGRIDQGYRQHLMPYLMNVRGATRLAMALRRKGLASLCVRDDPPTVEICDTEISAAASESFAAFLTERVAAERFLQEARDVEVVADVGAYHGIYGLLATEIAGCKAFAFEPDAENFESVERNRDLNGAGRLHPVRAAVLDEERSVTTEASGNVKNTVTRGDGEVDAVSLDGFFDDRETPDLIKIDVEGAEMKVLRGAETVLQEEHPVLLLEVHKHESREPFDHDPTDVYAFLNEKDYEIETLEERRMQEIIIAR
ncbi:MAG: FkbM family methyltransferase [Halodesulfurarchaeum sp.]